MKLTVNFIDHQRKAYEKLTTDKNASALHVSMYFALFMYWNETGFEKELSISRTEIMSLSKIGSANTYTKVLKELDEWGYIKYKPSFNPLKGSLVTIITFDKGSGKGADKGSGKGSGATTDKGSDTLYKQEETIQTEENNTKPNKHYSLFMNEYDTFFKNKVGAPPKIDGQEGKALKSIIAYIEKVAKDKNVEPLTSWKAILDSFDKWEAFHQKNLKLSQISSNLTNIINSIRNGTKQKFVPHYEQNRNELLDLARRAREANAALGGGEQ